jgi:hypothetical protein
VRRTTIRKRMRKKLQEIKQQLRQRMHDPVPKPANGSGRWCKATSTTTQCREISIASESFGTGCCAFGGKHSGVVAKRASPRGLADLHSPDNGFPNLVCSILIPQLASPPVIRDKSRMR